MQDIKPTSQDSLNGFHAIYEREFGEVLSQGNAERKARMLLSLYVAVYRSIHDVMQEVTNSN